MFQAQLVAVLTQMSRAKSFSDLCPFFSTALHRNDLILSYHTGLTVAPMSDSDTWEAFLRTHTLQ
jgi:hypothetical protein